jgi:hypothetical protein
VATTVRTREPAPPRRRRIGALGAGTIAVSNMLARLVATAAAIVALVIVIGIVLVVLKANPSNAIVSWFHDAARFLAGPFDGIFKPKDPKVAVAINWGLAAIVYLVAGRLVAGLLRR